MKFFSAQLVEFLFPSNNNKVSTVSLCFIGILYYKMDVIEGDWRLRDQDGRGLEQNWIGGVGNKMGWKETLDRKEKEE